MYDFERVEASYEFLSCVTYTDCHKSNFRKIEHMKAECADGSYVFTMLGSTEESVDGIVPEGWGEIILKFGKALYPISLKVNENGEVFGINEFEKFKEQWMTRRREIVESYENNFFIKKESYRYALALKTEEKFIDILRRNMFYCLLLWQDVASEHKVEIRDFPASGRLAIFTFNDKKYDDNGGVSYETGQVNDEGSGRLLSGQAKLQIYRDKDGLPKEIKLKARVEEAETGYFTKEITIKRL